MSVDKSPLVSFIESTFGGNYFVDTQNISVSTTPIKAVTNNYDRVSLIMTNTGSADIFLYPGGVPVGGQGLLVGANGGVVSFQAKDDLVLVGYDWSAVTLTGTSNLLTIAVKQY